MLHKAPAIHPLSCPNGLTYKTFEIAQIFANTFEARFILNMSPHIPEKMTASTAQNKNNFFMAPNNIENIINQMAKRKAPDENMISNASLKNLSPTISKKNIILLLPSSLFSKSIETCNYHYNSQTGHSQPFSSQPSAHTTSFFTIKHF